MFEPATRSGLGAHIASAMVLKVSSTRNAVQRMTHSPFEALRARDFRLFWIGAISGTIGFEMQGTAVGWELYERTHSALALGYIGLATVFPLIALVLPAGHIVDTVDRRLVLIGAQATM